MWKICRQILTGRWTNVKPIPSTKGNQSEVTVEGKDAYCTSRIFVQKPHFVPKGEFRAQDWHKDESTHEKQKDLFKPSLLDTLSWLGVSAAITFRLQRYFCSSSERDKNAAEPRNDHCCNFWRQVLFRLAQDNASYKVLPKTGSISASRAASLPLPTTSQSTLVPTAPQESSAQVLFAQSQKVISHKEIPAIEKAFHQLNSVANECAGLIENQNGVEAAKKCKEKVAFEHFHYSAKNFNCIKANYNLGVCYEVGCGTKVDLSKAAYHYMMAAQQAHPAALYNLGLFYMEGRGGLPKDPGRGFFYIHQSARRSFSEALLYLGICFHEQERHSKAVRYFQAAADKEDPNGLFYLALCYQNGWGFTLNFSKALHFFKKASLKGMSEATFTLAQMYEKGTNEVSQDIKQASVMYHLAAQQGHPKAAHKHLEMDLLLTLGAIKDSKPSSSQGRPLHISSSTSNLKQSERQELNLPSSYLGLILPAFRVNHQHLTYSCCMVQPPVF